MTEPHVIIATPRRSDGGRRDQLWAFCSTWWQERFNWPIMVGESPDGPFNRGAAINQAAKAGGDWDVMVIVDGDVVAEPEQVQAAVDRAHETGRLTFAFSRYLALNESMSNRVLTGFNGNWMTGTGLKMNAHVSSIIAVPRPLWDVVHGFDERCEGWGYDDTIFAHACRVLGGGIERVRGDVWHLWHPVDKASADFHRGQRRGSASTPHLRASAALADRYRETITPAQVKRIISERVNADSAVMVVLTHGRRECIEQTIPAALANLKGLQLDRLIISDDSADIEYQAWLRLNFPAADLITSARQTGFAGNMRRAWEAALASGQRWIVWFEDDFIVQRPADLRAMSEVLDANPRLSQIVLKRQAWFKSEVEAGGLIESHGAAAIDMQDDDGNQWVEHGLGHWTNPHLLTRDFLATHDWPNVNGSEAKFAKQMQAEGRRSAYWGPRTDPPLVDHIGERNGIGY